MPRPSAAANLHRDARTGQTKSPNMIEQCLFWYQVNPPLGRSEARMTYSPCQEIYPKVEQTLALQVLTHSSNVSEQPLIYCKRYLIEGRYGDRVLSYRFLDFGHPRGQPRVTTGPFSGSLVVENGSLLWAFGIQTKAKGERVGNSTDLPFLAYELILGPSHACCRDHRSS